MAIASRDWEVEIKQGRSLLISARLVTGVRQLGAWDVKRRHWGTQTLTVLERHKAPPETRLAFAEALVQPDGDGDDALATAMHQIERALAVLVCAGD